MSIISSHNPEFPESAQALQTGFINSFPQEAQVATAEGWWKHHPSFHTRDTISL